MATGRILSTSNASNSMCSRDKHTHTVRIKAFVYEEHQTADQVRQFIDSVLEKVILLTIEETATESFSVHVWSTLLLNQ